MSSLLSVLCRTNQSILKQKRDLINVLELKHGIDKLCDIYQTPSPIINASIGQHIRHSMDHIERVTNAISYISTGSNGTNTHQKNMTLIHYDIRERGKNDEHDVLLAMARIDRVHNTFEEIIKSSSSKIFHDSTS